MLSGLPLLHRIAGRRVVVIGDGPMADAKRRLIERAGFEAHVWHIDNSLEYRDRRRALRWVLREYAAWAAMLARGR